MCISNNFPRRGAFFLYLKINRNLTRFCDILLRIEDSVYIDIRTDPCKIHI